MNEKEFTYPLFRRHTSITGLVVKFLNHDTIEVVEQGNYHHKKGIIQTNIVNHEHSMWEPCEDPTITKTSILLKHIRSL